MDAANVLRAGGALLIASAIPAIWLVASFPSRAPVQIPHRALAACVATTPMIQLPLAQILNPVSLGALHEQIAFSIDPARPSGSAGGDSPVLLFLTPSKEMRRAQLPARFGLRFDAAGVLQFSDEASLFWLDCADGLTASFGYKMPSGEVEGLPAWNPQIQETPFQAPGQFAEKTPFRELADAKWQGPHFLLEGAHRLEVGANLLDCSLQEWLVYQENRWRVVPSLEGVSEEVPIAHIRNVSSQSLEVEGWNGASHVRLKLPLVLTPPLKIKGEELFSQLRVRSERQVSCMLDKQCFVLRLGDWVLKNGARWKVVKRADEREQIMSGKLVGDLFILDRIETKASAKGISGRYCDAGRTQWLPIEYVQKGHAKTR